ncbi:MAG: NPCBM/NEW2 domain-containing protein [Planctomycetota bacterium]
MVSHRPSARVETFKLDRPVNLPYPEKTEGKKYWHSATVKRFPSRRGKVFLDELPETSFVVAHGTLGKLGRAGVPGASSIRVAKQKFAHGLQLHPPSWGTSRVTYRLGGAYTKLSAGVAVAENGNLGKKVKGTLTFEIWGDGKKLAEKAGIKTCGKPFPITADITGVDSLVLVVRCAGTSASAWATWLNPVLEK